MDAPGEPERVGDHTLLKARAPAGVREDADAEQ